MEDTSLKFNKITFLLILLILTFIVSSCVRSHYVKTPTTTINIAKAPAVYKKHFYKKVIIKSKFLNRNMFANVYLPPRYNKKLKYPVLYIIHGDDGSENFCLPGLDMDITADKLIRSKRIEPLIIISPEMDNSLGLNSAIATRTYKFPKRTIELGRYEDYLSKELVSYVDSHYSTITNRAGRYIGGMSTGGYISLHTAFRHPNEYSKVGGHSPDITQKFPDNRISPLYFPTKADRTKGSIYYLASKNTLKNLDIYLDCGKSDIYKLYNDCNKLYKILKSKGAHVQYHLNPGPHASSYWKSNMIKYLTFYAGKYSFEGLK